MKKKMGKKSGVAIATGALHRSAPVYITTPLEIYLLLLVCNGHKSVSHKLIIV